MEKVYRLLQWLDMAQALDFLQDLTETPVTEYLLLQLCEARQCQAFADVDGLKGEDLMNSEPATAIGIHLVTDPVDAFGSEWGSSTVRTEGDIQGGISVEWKGELLPWKRGPIFRPADIEALAAKMNGAPEQPGAAEVEDLRRQLEQERAARKTAEVEAADLRRAMDEDHYAREAADRDEAREMAHKHGDLWLEQLRRDELLEHQAVQLEKERIARQAAEQRAEQAETEAKPSHMLAIAGLLELLLDGSRPLYNQGSAADAIEGRHPDWRGSSASQLTKLFAEAKATAREADKVAQAKAEARQAAASRAEARKAAKT